MTMTLHEFVDFNYGPNGDSQLQEHLAQGEESNVFHGSETPLHVAVRRRRRNAVAILPDHGARIDAKNGRKTAYAHALRRGFNEVAALLAGRGADTALNDADRLAVAIVGGRLDDARTILMQYPNAVRTGNPDEDRLLADVAGRHDSEVVALLITAGADLAAPGLDTGTPVHQAAWFGQPAYDPIKTITKQKTAKNEPKDQQQYNANKSKIAGEPRHIADQRVGPFYVITVGSIFCCHYREDNNEIPTIAL